MSKIAHLRFLVAEAAKAWLIRYEDEVRDEAEEAPCKNLVAAVDALVAAESSPESPAKEQPGGQNAAPQVAGAAMPSYSQTGEGDIAGPIAGAADTIVGITGKECDLTHSAVAAPDVAALVKRLREALPRLNDAALSSYAKHRTHLHECLPLLRDAAAMIEKLGQGWIPVEWQELGGVPGPENEPSALVAWISVAQKEGVEELFRRMQKRLLLWEREKLSPETYEKIKDWAIYTEPPTPERP